MKRTLVYIMGLMLILSGCAIDQPKPTNTAAPQPLLPPTGTETTLTETVDTTDWKTTIVYPSLSMSYPAALKLQDADSADIGTAKELVKPLSNQPILTIINHALLICPETGCDKGNLMDADAPTFYTELLSQYQQLPEYTAVGLVTVGNTKGNVFIDNGKNEDGSTRYIFLFRTQTEVFTIVNRETRNTPDKQFDTILSKLIIK